MKKALILCFFFLFSCNEQTPEKPQMRAWARPAQQGGNTAAYFTIQNHSSVTDTLRSIKSPAAGMAQIHESYETDDGLMGMREVKNLILQPGEKLQLERGGLHLMLMNLKNELEAGDTLKIQLNWSVEGDTLIEIPIIGSSEILDDH